MIKRVLLIDVDNTRKGKDTDQLFSSWSHPPLGLMYLAAAAQKALPELEIEVFHTITSSAPMEDIEARVNSFDPDVVGLRALSIARDRFKEVARLVRSCKSDCVLIGGGPFTSSSYEEIMQEKVVDLACIGEGELTFVEILERLSANGQLPTEVAGTAIHAAGGVFVNPHRPAIADLDSLPFPNFDLINLQDYKGISNHALQDATRSAFICASRGCVFTCFYCHQLFGKRIRHRSPKNVVEEMRLHVEERGLRNFVFVDDMFNVPMKECKELLSCIARELPGVRLNFPNGLRADQIDAEMVDLFEEAGTVLMSLAIESASPRLQKLMGKRSNLDRAISAVHAASQRFVTGAFFMVGFPTETYEEALETLKLAESFDHLCQPVLSVVRLFTGTPLFEMLEPDEAQRKAIAEQEQGVFHTRLLENVNFYGDLFPREKVPMTSREIQALRWIWMRKVQGNKTRIRNGHKILSKFFDNEQIFEFYRNILDNPSFGQHDLDQMLAA